MTSYSQVGEDMIARHFLHHVTNGHYVDVGASDPVYYNNTYYFYEQGWRGILVDPLPEACQELRDKRPEDTVLQNAVGPSGVATLSIFSPSQLSTIKLKTQYIAAEVVPVGEIPVTVIPLRDILQQQATHLLSVDCEGMELQVLESNDWDKYRPLVIICETKVFWGNDRNEPQITAYLHQQGYVVLADTWINTIYSLPEIRR